LLHILYGPDDYRLDEAVRRIKAEAGDVEALATNTTTFEGRTVTVDQLRPVCEAAPFLAEKRLVIIDGLLTRYEPKRRARRPASAGKRKTPVKKDDPKPLAEYLPTVPPTTIVILRDGDIKPANTMLKALAGKGRPEVFPLLREAQVRQWLRARAQEKKVSIAGAAIDLMAKTVGSNLWIMSNELEKLTLYAAGRQIETADVELLGGYSQQQKIFYLVDAIVEGRTESATKQLEQTLQSGASPSYVMAMLARQMRLIVTARELKAQRVPMPEARGRLANSPEFAVQRLFKQSADYSLPRLRHVYQLMTEADQSIKTGHSEPEMAVGMLVSELCRKGA